MKKALLVLVSLLVIGAVGAGGYFLVKNPDIFETGPAKASADGKKGDKNKDGKSAIKRPSTHADLLEAIAGDREKNPDTVGWLTIPGTDISDSVQQSYNNSFYLRKTKEKKDDIYGCYFADYECSFGTKDKLSKNTIIYGHSDLKDNKDGPKFSQLFRFTDYDFSKKTPYINFSTLEDGINWQVFAAFYTDVSMKYIYSNYNSEKFLALVEQAKSKSVFTYNVPVSVDDKILTLSTCSVRDGTDGTHRFVVMARMITDGEKLSATADITENLNAPGKAK